MSDLRKYLQPDGPFRAADIRPGDYYELYRGHPIECAPTGGDGARGVATGVHVLDTDPDVEELGVDAGFAPEPKTLWAPDIAVGRVPDKPGWIAGVPPLAVEYAGPGQDDETLAAKIAGLLSHGTRYIWVVKLTGPRRVEVYTADEPVKTLGPGEVLRAPGVLRNPVPVEALYDRRKSLELAFSNLLQREGYNSLDEVRAEGLLAGIEKGIEKGIEQGIEKGIEQGIEKGIEQGIEKGIEQGIEKGIEQGIEKGIERGEAQGIARSVCAVLELRGIALSDDQMRLITECTDSSRLEHWLKLAVLARSADEMFSA